MPPINPNIPDSTTKINKINLFLAPIDFITPISLVLSKTEVYIVFAIFTAATNTEIKAINTSIIIKISITAPYVAIISS